MKTITLFVAALALAGCGGGGAGPGGCTPGSGVFTLRCQSFTCSDGSGSCAENDPADVRIILQGQGVGLTGDWITDSNTFTADRCDQSIVAHKTVNGATASAHWLVSCDDSGTLCTVDVTLSIPGGACVERAALFKS